MNTLKTLPLALLLALGSSLAIADTPIHETRPLDRDASVHISNVTGEVKVRGWDQDRIEITGTLGEGAKPLIVEGDNDDLRIKVEAANKGGWLNWGGDSRMKPTVLDIRLPRGVELDIDVVSANADLAELEGGKIEVDSVSGRVRVAARTPSLSVDTVSGNVDFSGQADEVDIDTVSGDISAPATGSHKASLDTVSGDVHFHGGSIGKLDASSVSGDLAIAAGLAPGGRLSVDTMSGDVSLDLPAGTSAQLEASSFSGDIDSAFGEVDEPEHGPGSKLHATLGDGDGTLKVETFSGDIRIRRGD